MCSMMLGDLGAQVIKVERSKTGDDTRSWGPPFAENGQSAYYLSVNRNKLALAADFSDTADVALLRELASNADVLIENFLPGTLTRYGLDAESILAQNEKLIWCTLSGFGPDSARPGYDFVIQAECGWMAITGPDGGAPYKVGVALADVIAGKDAAIAILAALVGRGSAPPAQRQVHISLKASATAALVNVAQNSLVTGMDARRWGNAHPNLVPYQLFDASDRPLVIAVGNDRQWMGVVAALQLTELGADSSLFTNPGRLANRARVVGRISERLRAEPAHYWVARLEREGVPCGVVKGVLEALQSMGASAETGVPPATGGAIRRIPPSLDEHGEIIRKMHWSAFKVVPILG
jgi:crotonobetainyl-CoA:carnitine CoA-transferase CaiB-like acyl-CoA transferase